MADRGAPDTVTEALELLRAEAYVSSFEEADTPSALRCSSCGASHAVAGLEAERLYRFEGPSDPGDEAVVAGLRCPACGAKGTFASAYGPAADPDRVTALAPMLQRWRATS